MTTTELGAIRNAMEAATQGGAGEEWDHPAAAEARRLSGEAGMAWDFTSWPAALNAVARALDESGLHRVLGVWVDHAEN